MLRERGFCWGLYNILDIVCLVAASDWHHIFYIENINGFNVSFNIKELLSLTWFLFFQFGAILALLDVLDDAINFYIWREHEKN